LSSTKPRTAGSSLARRLDRITEELEDLRARNEALEARVAELEASPAAPGAPPVPPAAGEAAEEGVPPALSQLDGELRPDVFGPAEVRTSSSSHRNAVNKALSMLGLVPTEEDAANRERASAGHKKALDKAIAMMGRDPAAAATAPAAEAGDGDASGAPPEAPGPEPVAAGPAAAAAAVRWEVAERSHEEAPDVDLETAVPVELERADGLGSIAVMILLAGAAAAWVALGPVAATGVSAAVFAAVALFARAGSSHLRATAAGAATLLLHALALGAVPGLPLAVVGLAVAAASAAGAWAAAHFRHPLVVFVGFLGATAAAPWLAPDGVALAVFAVVVSTAAAWAAARLRRLQMAVAVLAVSAPLVGAPWAAVVMAAVHLALALAATRHRRPGKAPVVLALAALGLFAWTAHGLVAGPLFARVALLVLPAMVAAFASAAIPRGLETFSAALRASAVLLVISVLPLGFSGPVLAGATLLVASLFGAFALALDDAWLRAVGALVLFAATAILLALGPTPPFLFAIAGAALLLYAVPAKGRLVPALLAALAVASTLAALARALPPVAVAPAWGTLALALGAVGRRWPGPLARGGVAAAVGASAGWALAFTPTPAALGAAALLVLPHVWLLGPLRRPREAGAMLLVVELMVVATLQAVFPGPAGVLAALPLLAVLVLPVWGVLRHMLRAHARVLSFVLLVRCLLPDVRGTLDAPLGLAAVATAATCVAVSLFVRRPAAPTSAREAPPPPPPPPSGDASPAS